MNKKDEGELKKVLERIVGNLEGSVNVQKEFSNILNRIIELIELLVKSTNFIFFILSLIIWKVFLLEPFNNFMNMIIKKWSSLTEGYQLLILGFIGAIISGIIAYIVGFFLLEKIKSILKSTSMD